MNLKFFNSYKLQTNLSSPRRVGPEILKFVHYDAKIWDVIFWWDKT